MITTRSAIAHWSGTGTKGEGHLTTPSTVLHQTRYSYLTRFADGVGTNPEELIAAAHAGCFSMKLAFDLQALGLTATAITTTCELSSEEGEVVRSHLRVYASVPGITPSQFEEVVESARQNCLISKVLNLNLSSEARLVDEAAITEAGLPG
ncbi:OsmC family peroxiredoxin [Hymenobacter profundi]|uniref:OsmC family peroxiredoxin n=1 Tax=Hymenobacter profundi TaxID=1982110 RepID=A0ABS6X592_9BACT|nr:OsmC family peroxiredoxin [Hymenobacter profundi]MBW3130109.1 OsmC family peroxiredoxin [Hymenobacter profundi]